MSWLKRRHDVINNTIQTLKTELYLNDIVLTTALGQRIASVYDRTLMAAELYKERLEALTQSSRFQIWRVQSGQNPLVPTPVPLMSLDLNHLNNNSTFECDSWAPKRRKPNYAEGYTHNRIINNQQQLTHNRNKKKKNNPKRTVLPAAKTVEAIPKTIATVSKIAGLAANGTVPAANATIPAVKTIAAKNTAGPKPTAFATLITAAKATSSAVNTTAVATETVASVANMAISTAKATPVTKATPATKTTPATKAKAKTKGKRITKASPVAKVKAPAVIPPISTADMTEQERKWNIVKNFKPKWVPMGQEQILGTSAVNQTLQVKTEPNGNEIIQNTPSFFSVDMSQIRLQFAASDRITIKSEPNPLNWAGNINCAADVTPAPVNGEDMMIDDLADHL